MIKNARLEMRAHSTADISSISYYYDVVKLLEEIFPDSPPCLVLDDGDKREVILCDQVTVDTVRKINNAQFLRLTDKDEKKYFFSIIWVKIKDLDQHFKKNGQEQNVVFFSVCDDQVKADDYISFCIAISELFEVNYQYSYFKPTASINFKSKLGLSIGLLDVYWLNIFGKPYIEMIGEKKLLDTPAYKVQKLKNSILVQSDEEFIDPTSALHMESAKLIRSHIGNEYFAGPVPDDGIASGNVGCLGLIKLLFSMKKNFNDVSYKAQVTPSFDWSRML